MKRKVLIIGAGGIGSYLIPLLDQTNLYSLTVLDPDKIEEKNLTYQNFKSHEVGMNKATAMMRYDSVNGHPVKCLTNKQMAGYDLVICCVDNLDARKLLYRQDIHWLDLRAQGRNAVFISFLTDEKQYGTVTAGPSGSFSCQGNEWDGSNGQLHYMHVVAAGMGAEWTQRYFAGDKVGDNKFVNV
jgi:hypothetical protein